VRKASVSRSTAETDITIALNLDGSGQYDSDVPVGFFWHMLSLMTRHGLLDLQMNVVGDTEIDAHHTVEDVGIVLGQALKQALGDKKGIKRYGSATIPMDEVLALCAIDLSGRPFLKFDASFTVPSLGNMDTELVKEFFQSLSVNAGMNIHIKVFHGENNHHIAEAIFKAFAHALREAVSIDPKIKGVLSTKGSI